MAKEAVQALVDLGVPREQIPVATEVDAFEAKMCQLAVETTAAPAEPELAKESEVAPNTSADPIATDPPTEPEPRRPR
jgi:hypothetical protein